MVTLLCITEEMTAFMNRRKRPLPVRFDLFAIKMKKKVGQDRSFKVIKLKHQPQLNLISVILSSNGVLVMLADIV